MERVIEAGAYRYRSDFEKKVREQPFITMKLDSIMGGLPKSPLRPDKIVKYVPTELITRYSRPITMDLKTVGELTAKENSLDKQLSEEYEIFDPRFQQESLMCGLRQQNMIYTQSKSFLLRTKEEAALSYLNMNLELRYLENEFYSAYLEASINGTLAQENSPLARSIVEYWRNNNLVIINNVIRGEGEDSIFSEGSIKAEAAREYIELICGDEALNSIIRELPPKIKEFFLREGVKDIAQHLIRQSFPIKVIKENR